MQSNFCVPKFPKTDVRSSIVPSYFQQWVKMVMPHAKKLGDKIGFLDFYSGNGVNDDGSQSAPVLILKGACGDNEIGDRLVCVLRDREVKNVIKLKQSVASIAGIESLKHEPHIEKGNSYDDLVSSLQMTRIHPSLVLVDPFQIKEFDLLSFSNHLRDGSFDCFFHFDYTHLEKTIENPFKTKYLETVFGKLAASHLRSVAERLNPVQRESLVIDTLLGCLKNTRACHNVILKYEQKASKTVSYLIFVTKYVTRFRLMRETMVREGYREVSSLNAPIGPANKEQNAFQRGLFEEEKNE